MGAKGQMLVAWLVSPHQRAYGWCFRFHHPVACNNCNVDLQGSQLGEFEYCRGVFFFASAASVAQSRSALQGHVSASLVSEAFFFSRPRRLSHNRAAPFSFIARHPDATSLGQTIMGSER